jgi:hypothetical protein
MSLNLYCWQGVNTAKHISIQWERSDAVGSDTVLQDGRLRVRLSMVSLEFFINWFLRSHYGPGVDLASNRNE